MSEQTSELKEPEANKAQTETPPASATVQERHSAPVAFLINFFRRLGTLLFTSVKEFLNDECQNLAAQISYYALFSVFPLILVTIVIVSFLVPDDNIARERLIQQLTGNFPANTVNFGAIVREALRQISNGQPLFITVSIIGLIWAGTGVFDSVTNALNKAWQIEGVKQPPRSLLESLFLRFVLTLIFGLMLLASIVVTLIFDAVHSFADNNEQLRIILQGSFIWDLAAFFIPWMLTFVTFMLVYQVTPQRKVSWVDVWPGSVLATVLFEIVKSGFTFYISRFTNYSLTYGPVAGVMVFLFWLYLIAVILLLGGQMSSVWAEMRGDKKPRKLARQGKQDEAPPAPASSPGQIPVAKKD
jgi:membrane protein